MSNSLAVASVSAVIRDILINRLAQDPVASLMSTVDVSVSAPDRIDLSASVEPNQVNIFLHQVTPNMGYANSGLPYRSANGTQVGSEPLVLDLHYLISFYGSQPFFAEILFGEIAQEFHERPLLARDIITRALNPAAPPSNFPTELSDSGLDTQIESIKITPQAVSNEELSKMWGAFQANYRLTAAYQVTTVLIDSLARPRVALPVGQTLSQADALAIPEVTRIYLQGNPQGSILPGATLHVEGRNLDASGQQVLIDETDMTAQVSELSPTSFNLSLPNALPNIRPGAVSLQVMQPTQFGNPPTVRNIISSNTAVFLLKPEFSAVVNISSNEDIDGTAYRNGDITLTVNPAVGAEQKVSVILNQVLDPFNAYTLTVPDGNGVATPDIETTAIVLPFTRLAAGDYLIRIKIDLAESALTRDVGTGQYNGPSISL